MQPGFEQKSPCFSVFPAVGLTLGGQNGFPIVDWGGTIGSPSRTPVSLDLAYKRLRTDALH
ncbi:hypothetical protein K239x_25480 [Planctomycetes bacterium K23_9]|uniref:Uncharacterized protein n=1 Tax=Stieleria marina TaxID=1930275 RepID=A0A517NTZ2_9BACT|nr:hypothetical protein K239x_25480 [Planctomycetes bacterium K23_9]